MAKIIIVVTSTTEVSEKLADLQKKAGEYFLDRYAYSPKFTHGNLPFHITLVSPFEESKLAERHEFLADYTYFESTVILTGISIFMPNVVYAKVDDSKGTLQGLHDFFHGDLGQEPARERFVPHVSLARRFPEINLTQAREAFEVHAQSLFPLEFPLKNITMYRNEGGQWQRYQRHTLAS